MEWMDAKEEYVLLDKKKPILYQLPHPTIATFAQKFTVADIRYKVVAIASITATTINVRVLIIIINFIQVILFFAQFNHTETIISRKGLSNERKYQAIV